MSEPYIGDLLRKQGEKELEDGLREIDKIWEKEVLPIPDSSAEPLTTTMHSNWRTQPPKKLKGGEGVSIVTLPDLDNILRKQYEQKTDFKFRLGTVTGLTNFPNRNSGVEADEPIIVDASKNQVDYQGLIPFREGIESKKENRMGIPQNIQDDLGAVEAAFEVAKSDQTVVDADAASIVTAQAAVDSAKNVQAGDMMILSADQQKLTDALNRFQTDVQAYYGVPAAVAVVGMVHCLHNNEQRKALNESRAVSIDWQSWVQKILAFLQAVEPLIPAA